MTHHTSCYAGGRNAARKSIVFSQSLTLAEAADHCCRSASRSTRDIAHALLRQADACAGHPVLVKECTAAFVRRLDGHMCRQNLGCGTRRTYLERLGVLLRSVRGWSAPDIAPLLPPRNQPRKCVISADEAHRLRAAINADKGCTASGRAFLLSLQTALRFSDIAQLDWRHIHRDGSGYCLRKPMQKTGQLIEIDLSDTACALLSEQLGAAGLPCKPQSGRVFKDLPPYPTALRQLKRLGAAAGCDPRAVTFHVARHTFASVLHRHSVPIATISKFLGHSSLSITETYIHSFRQDEQHALALMNLF